MQTALNPAGNRSIIVGVGDECVAIERTLLSPIVQGRLVRGISTPQLSCQIVADSSDLEARVAALEARLGEVEQQVSTAQTDASAARELAAGADRDVSEVRAELRAHTRALNALREPQVEQGHAMDRGFAEMRAGLDQTTGGLDQILGLLNTLITRDDKS